VSTNQVQNLEHRRENQLYQSPDLFQKIQFETKGEEGE
jgi:hypothetical protein